MRQLINRKIKETRADIKFSVLICSSSHQQTLQRMGSGKSLTPTALCITPSSPSTEIIVPIVPLWLP
jgi:hypothetical protein